MPEDTEIAKEIEAIDRDLSRPGWKIALSPGLERDFDCASYAQRAKSLRRWSYAGIATALACLPFDYLMGIQVLGLITRLGVILPVYLLSALVMHFGPRKLHSVAIVAPVATFAVGVLFLGMNLAPSDGAKYFMATALLLLFTNIVVPVPFREALATVVITNIAMIALLLSAGNLTPELVGTAFFVTGTAFAPLLVRFHSERELRDTFLLRRKDTIKSEHLLALTEALAELAETDPLTELPNRRHLSKALAEKWREAREQGSWISILMIDIDHFKSFNDAAGHDEGDNCLRAVAGALRRESGKNGYYLARYGGEEFTAVLTGLAPEPAMLAAESLRNAVEQLNLHHPAEDRGDFVTVSIGASTLLPSTQQDVKQLLTAADKALYEAKISGRNRIAFGPVIATTAKSIAVQKAG